MERSLAPAVDRYFADMLAPADDVLAAVLAANAAAGLPPHDVSPLQGRMLEILARAGVAARVDLRVGNALDTLPRLRAEGRCPFDLVFVDADKRSSVAYLDAALALTRAGSVLVFDNVVREGAVLDASSEDPSVHGVRQLAARLAAEPRVVATALQTVGTKGWDGFALALVVSPDPAPPT